MGGFDAFSFVVEEGVVVIWISRLQALCIYAPALPACLLLSASAPPRPQPPPRPLVTGARLDGPCMLLAWEGCIPNLYFHRPLSNCVSVCAVCAVFACLDFFFGILGSM